MKEETARQKKVRIAVAAGLTLLLALLVLPLLWRGSLAAWRLTAGLTGVLVFLPLFARPYRDGAKRALLALHDAALLIAASALSLLTTEYVVKGLTVNMQKSLWQGLLCYLALYAALYLICGRARLAVCIGQAVFLVHALVDHYVTLFRGTPVLLGDILAIGTAADVAEGYSVPVEKSVLLAALAALLFCTAVWRMRRVWRAPARRRLPVVLALAVLVCGGLRVTGTGIGFWQSSRSYSEIFYFLRCANESVVRKPAGYGDENMARIMESHPGETGEKKPNLIVVMNESFADLEEVGPFTTNEDYMPYVRSLAGKENTVTGKLLVSTFGGGTANTEFEFLTGATMGFLPFGCSPYQMYIRAAMPTLVSSLKGQGYEAVSLHPYLASSWSRDRVYERFGFDRQLYEEDFAEDAARVRYRVSDSEDYRKIYELYEQKPEGQPLFVFNVTMQNHGGYAPADYPNFDPKIYLTGEYEGQYPDVDNYLSLVRYSDDAVRELIAYFEAADEPAAIIFFGDHQPKVDAAFYTSLLGGAGQAVTSETEQKKMVTPFFIWANYDIAEAQDVTISANYLSAYALDLLGLGSSGYDALRLAAREAVPAINSFGYYDTAGAFHEVQQAASEESLADYRIAQYRQLFDTKNRQDAFYQLPDEEKK